MGKASSAKKVARLAERGKGKKVRFQGGTVFPLIIGVIIVLGLVLVGYARDASRVDAAGPQAGDHWHLVYGINICGEYLDPFQANKEDTIEYQEVQIHSHGDGVMHWHPGTGAINRSTGRKAQFDVFLDLYGVDLTDEKLTISGDELTPPEATDRVYEEGVTTCPGPNGEPEKASLRVIVWDRYDLPDARTVRTSALGNERIKEDQQVFVVAFIADRVQNNEIQLPSWAADLPELGAADTGEVLPDSTSTTVAGATTSGPVGTDPTTTLVGATTVAGATTVPATTSAATTASTAPPG